VGLSKQSHGWIDGDGAGYGPLFWPYQAIYLSCSQSTLPHLFLSMPILKLLNIQTLFLQYGVWFGDRGWWWWIGLE